MRDGLPTLILLLSLVPGRLLQGGSTWFGSPSGAGLGVCYSTTGIFTEITAIPVSLSLSEGASIGGRCAAILGNGSGFGVCNSCKAGALGGTKLPQ